MLERHRTHENDENDAKKGPGDMSTTCLLGPGMYVVFFVFFFFLLLMIIYRYTMSMSTVTTNGHQNDNNNGEEGWQRERPKKGAQTMKHSFVVCALGSRRIVEPVVTSKKNGPNDARRVVWVICTCFFYFLFFMFLLF
jgi:hypothetical protein